MQRLAGICLAALFALMQIAPAALTCCLQPSCIETTSITASQESCCCTDVPSTSVQDESPCDLMQLVQAPDWTPLQQSVQLDPVDYQSYELPSYVLAIPLAFIDADIEYGPRPLQLAVPSLAVMNCATVRLLI